MKIERLYDKVAKTYNQELSAEVLSKANNAACLLMKDKVKGVQEMLALGIGDGHHLLPYQKLKPELTIHGLDISSQMLEKAKQNLDCKTYHGNINNTAKLVGRQNFDFITAHFVCAYVELDTLLNQCHQVINSNGYLSLVSNTHESFKGLRAIFDKYLSTDTFISKQVGAHVTQALKTVHVPESLEQLQQSLKSQQFKCVESWVDDIEITLSSYEEFYQFFIQGGWFVSGLMHPVVPEFILRAAFKQLVKRYISFPYTDHLNIAIVIAKKSD